MKLRAFLIAILASLPALAAEVPEVYENNFYRAPGGTACVTLPAADKNWQVSLATTKEGQRMVQYTLAGARGYRCFFNLVFTLKYAGEKDLTDGLLAVAEGVKAKTPDLAPSGNPHVEKSRNGTLLTARLSLEGPRELGELRAITDGSAVVLVIVRGLRQDFPGVMSKTVEPMLNTLYVGRTVPRLGDQSPGVRLEGVYQGPYEIDRLNDRERQFWFIFDRRGFVTDDSPSGIMAMDFDAKLQQRTRKPWMGAYTIAGNTLTIRWNNGTTKNYPVQVQGKTITVDKRVYYRVDGLSDGTRLAGHYRSSSTSSGYGEGFTFYSSSDYYFSQDGRFSCKSFASIESVNRNSAGRMTDWSSFSTGKAAPDKGVYRVSGDRLWLHFDDGSTVYRTFYLRVLEGKVTPGRVFIQGAAHIKMDK